MMDNDVLFYFLQKNHLTSDPDDYMAVTTNAISLDLDAITQLMLTRGSTLTETDIAAVLKMEHEVICEQAAMGNNITTPVFNLSMSVKGTFEGPDDSFDSTRHTIKLNLNPGVELSKAVSSIKTQKVRGGKIIPIIDRLTDVATGNVNGQITSGGLATLKGSYLKYDTADTQQGIFFIAADASETRVVVISRNKPGELHFLAPALTAGEYHVEVRTIIKGHKEISSGRLDATITVTGS
jgi:hypothetical protein